MLNDVRNHAIKIGPYVFCRNPDRLEAMPVNPSVPPFVAYGIAAEIVRDAVNFDRHGRLFAEEVEHKWAERVLPAELQSFRALPKDSPKPNL